MRIKNHSNEKLLNTTIYGIVSDHMHDKNIFYYNPNHHEEITEADFHFEALDRYEQQQLIMHCIGTYGIDLDDLLEEYDIEPTDIILCAYENGSLAKATTYLEAMKACYEIFQFAIKEKIYDNIHTILRDEAIEEQQNESDLAGINATAVYLEQAKQEYNSAANV